MPPRFSSFGLVAVKLPGGQFLRRFARRSAPADADVDPFAVLVLGTDLDAERGAGKGPPAGLREAAPKPSSLGC